jgi:GNAT superfamily N-acetyltransferase
MARRRIPWDAPVDGVHDDMARCGMFVPVPLGGAEERSWLDCDLASLAENRCGDSAEFRLHAVRTTDEREYSLEARSEYERCYWILDGGVRTGTLALATSTLGGSRLRLSSFYIYPENRRRGLGANALATVEQILGGHDLGLRLETEWCWQGAVRFYMASGMWVLMWKHNIVFCSDPLKPPPLIDVGTDIATLSVERGKETIVLARAYRRGGRLELAEPDSALKQDESLGEALWNAEGTLSLAIALRGWPLVRSPRHWKENHWADAGPPESLAYKITLWEAWSRKNGWLVQTPRIAGLDYPTWDDLEAGIGV